MMVCSEHCLARRRLLRGAACRSSFFLGYKKRHSFRLWVGKSPILQWHLAGSINYLHRARNDVARIGHCRLSHQGRLAPSHQACCAKIGKAFERSGLSTVVTATIAKALCVKLLVKFNK